MMEGFQQNTVLPDLPFVDRTEHLSELLELFNDTSDTATRVALIDGEGGVGKTEVLLKATTEASGSCLFFWLPIAHQGGNHKGLIEIVIDVICNTFDRKSKIGKSVKKKKALIDVVKSVFPGAKSDMQEMVDIAPGTTVAVAQSVARSFADYIGVEGLTPRTTLNKLLKIIWKSNYKTIFIVDDLHELNRQHGQELINFFNMLDGVQDVTPQWTALMTSHPVKECLPASNALSKFWGHRSNWRFKFWTLHALDLQNMSRLAGKYIANSEVSDPVVNVSKGNPRLFMETIQKLALENKCLVHDKQVVIHGEITDTVLLNDTFRDTLVKKENKFIRYLCIALALESEMVPLSVLNDLGQHFDPRFTGFFERVKMLEELSYIILCENENGIECYRLQDDNKRIVVRGILKEFAMETQVVRRVLSEGYFNLIPRKIYTDLISIGDPARPISNEVTSAIYINYFIEGCIHSFKSKVGNSHEIAVAAIRILSHFERYSEVLKFNEIIKDYFIKSFDETSHLRVCIQCILCKAYYHVGEFIQCEKSLTWEQVQEIKKSEYLYYYAIAIVVAKEDSNPVIKNKKIFDMVSRSSYEDKSWEPQIFSAYAFSFQEYGQYSKSIIAYFGYYCRKVLTQSDNGWYAFAMMSPLFLPVRMARISCRRAYSFFKRTGNIRLAGMARHNEAYCYLRNYKFKQAYALFDEADRILSENAEEEAGFPKITKAFIHLYNGEGKEAKKLSMDALKYFKSPFYISAAYMNIALASWQLGEADAADYLEEIPRTSGLMEDPGQKWRINFNRAFITLNTETNTISQKMVDDFYEQLKESESTMGAAEFWNNMVDLLKQNNSDINWPKFDTSLSKNRSFINPDLAPYRASTLCFGHA